MAQSRSVWNLFRNVLYSYFVGKKIYNSAVEVSPHLETSFTSSNFKQHFASSSSRRDREASNPPVPGRSRQLRDRKVFV